MMEPCAAVVNRGYYRAGFSAYPDIKIAATVKRISLWINEPSSWLEKQ